MCSLPFTSARTLGIQPSSWQRRLLMRKQDCVWVEETRAILYLGAGSDAIGIFGKASDDYFCRLDG